MNYWPFDSFIFVFADRNKKQPIILGCFKVLLYEQKMEAVGTAP